VEYKKGLFGPPQQSSDKRRRPKRLQQKSPDHRDFFFDNRGNIRIMESCTHCRGRSGRGVFRGEALMVDWNHPQHPDINDEMWSAIDGVILSNRDQDGAVITVLRECQDIAGYLPVDLIDYISDGLNLSRSEVFGVASFYSLFSLAPKDAI